MYLNEIERTHRDTKVETILEIQNNAAKIIQKFYRGFHVRKIQLKLDPVTNAKRQKLTNSKTAICEPQFTMFYRTNLSLENLKSKRTSKAKIKASLEQINSSLVLLPAVQSKLILDCSGLNYLKVFITNCNKSPTDIEICMLCLKICCVLVDYVGTRGFNDKNACLEILSNNFKNILLATSSKFAYKQNENTLLLIRSSNLFQKTISNTWAWKCISPDIKDHHWAKFNETIASTKMILDNQVKFKNKVQWIANAKLLMNSFGNVQRK